MSPKPKAPKPGEWKYQVGEVPNLLTAFERADKRNAIYTRLWDGKRYTEKKALAGPIRDDAGKVIPEREIVAQQLAVARHTEILAGAGSKAEAGGPLTLAAAFRRFLDPKEGKFPSDTAHRREVTRAARLIQDVLGRDKRVEEIKHRDYRALWRFMAHEHKKTPEKYGLRSAEIYCGVLQNAARWLQQEGMIEPGESMPAPGWKQAMRGEWEQITGAPAGKPRKPRHTDAEMVRLWAHRNEADPRLRLALDIGAELRLGQVARVKRSDILPYKGFRIGRVRVHGRGKKLGETPILTMDQRHALTAALCWGYLAEPEAAYRAGELEDFYLIAGGRLHGEKDHRGRDVGRVRKHGANRPLTRRALASHFEELEELAKVKHQAGRLWYGMRRHQADKTAALQGVSDRAKNRMGGWSKTSTREGYLEEANTRDAEEAAVARLKIRPDGRQTRQRQPLSEKQAPE